MHRDIVPLPFLSPAVELLTVGFGQKPRRCYYHHQHTSGITCYSPLGGHISRTKRMLAGECRIRCRLYRTSVLVRESLRQTFVIANSRTKVNRWMDWTSACGVNSRAWTHTSRYRDAEQTHSPTDKLYLAIMRHSRRNVAEMRVSSSRWQRGDASMCILNLFLRNTDPVTLGW